jgi:hypothetical protein
MARLVPATHEHLIAPDDQRRRRCHACDAEIMGSRHKAGNDG